jgi:hypothetical protein
MAVLGNAYDARIQLLQSAKEATFNLNSRPKLTGTIVQRDLLSMNTVWRKVSASIAKHIETLPLEEKMDVLVTGEHSQYAALSQYLKHTLNQVAAIEATTEDVHVAQAALHFFENYEQIPVIALAQLGKKCSYLHFITASVPQTIKLQVIVFEDQNFCNVIDDSQLVLPKVQWIPLFSKGLTMEKDLKCTIVLEQITSESIESRSIDPSGGNMPVYIGDDEDPA